MTDSVSISTGIASRYANAVFELARDSHTITDLERDRDMLTAALAESADLRDMIESPLYTRAQTAAGISAVAHRMGVSQLMMNTLGLLAQKGRLFVLPQFLERLTRLIADHRGEISAEVASARPLTDTQRAQLEETLKAVTGQTVKIRETVDESLIGGLIVNLGSRMVDSTIASRLTRLQTAMKEVG